MKLAVSRLLCDPMSLELPRKQGGEPNFLEVVRGIDVRGTLDDTHGLHLERVAADTLELRRGRWTFGSRPLTVEPLALHGLTVDLHVRSGASPIGAVAARDLSAATVVLGLAADQRLQVERIAARGVTFRFIDGGITVEVEDLKLAGGELVLPGRRIRWDAAHAKRVAFRRDETDGTSVKVGELVVDGIAIELEHLDAHANGNGAAPRPPASATAGPAAPIDWHFLDAIDGQVDVDLTVAVKVPVIRKRTGTHEFRIAIREGQLDYHAAERQLSFLEDAIIDFELEDHRLILEKDIPLLAKDEKVLVYWPLDAEAHALAEQHLVRLRTLVTGKTPERRPEEPPPLPDEDPKQKSVRVLGVDADDIAVDLTIGAGATTPLNGGTLTFGRPGDALAGHLHIQGALHMRADGEPIADPGEVHLNLENAAVVLKHVGLGRGVTASGAIAATLDDVAVRFAKLAPEHVAMHTGHLAIADGVLHIAP